jgi:hypothetical protein
MMPNLTETLRTAWENRNGPVILATVDAAGMPNAIYATCVGTFGEDRLVVADNYFDKTRRNIQGGSKGAILFITKDNQAYQVKGRLEHVCSGPIFDAMKGWNPPKHPGHAAAVLTVEEAYSGATRLLPPMEG